MEACLGLLVEGSRMTTTPTPQACLPNLTAEWDEAFIFQSPPGRFFWFLLSYVDLWGEGWTLRLSRRKVLVSGKTELGRLTSRPLPPSRLPGYIIGNTTVPMDPSFNTGPGPSLPPGPLLGRHV